MILPGKAALWALSIIAGRKVVEVPACFGVLVLRPHDAPQDALMRSAGKSSWTRAMPRSNALRLYAITPAVDDAKSRSNCNGYSPRPPRVGGKGDAALAASGVYLPPQSLSARDCHILMRDRAVGGRLNYGRAGEEFGMSPHCLIKT